MDEMNESHFLENFEAALGQFFQFPRPEAGFLEYLGQELEARATRDTGRKRNTARLAAAFISIRWRIAASMATLALIFGLVIAIRYLLPAWETPPPATAISAATATPPAPAPSTTASATPTAAPTATAEPRTLAICLGAEPDTLFLYAGNMLVQRSILEAVYDGPIDTLGYNFQPVILEKLPSLADSDARIEPVIVQEGDRVVNQAGEVVTLKPGQVVRPYGCNRPECAITYQGGAIEMAQLSADFTLKEGIRWSDGELLTAHDSTFGYRVAKTCQTDFSACFNGLSAQWDSLAAFERTASYAALDARTTRWTGLPGYLDPNYMANYFSPLPEHQLRSLPLKALAEAREARETPMGWGPYVIERWRFGEYITLRKNPNYFRAAEGLPRFDRLVFRFVGEDSPTNISSLLSSECDLVDQDANLNNAIPQLLALEDEGQLRAHITTGTLWEHLVFSLGHADYDDGYQPGGDRPDLFGDPRTRQAIALCLDRRRIVDELLSSLSDVPRTYVPADHPLFNPRAASYPFSPEEGSRLLEEVGWIDHDGDPNTPRVARGVPNVPAGTPLAFGYWTTESPLRQQVGPLISASLAQCGVEARLQLWKAADFFELPDSPLFTRRFDLVEYALMTRTQPLCELFLSENIPGDPQAQNPDGKPRFPYGWEGQNTSGYRSAEFDQACRAALEFLPGQPGYVENHLLAQEIFARDLPAIPLFQRLLVTATSARLCGYRMEPTALSDTWGIEGYGVGDECGG